MAKIDINPQVIRIFEEVTSGTPVRENDIFEVYSISGEIFGKMSIILLKEGKELSREDMPGGTLFIPLEINSRDGFMTDIKTAITLAEKLSG